MKRIVRIVLIALFGFTFYASPAYCFSAGETESTTASSDSDSTFDWDSVMDAIIQVESGGNSRAKSGQSVGAMQITPVLVREVNRILKSRKSKKRYRLSDRLSVIKSKEMFKILQSFYNPLNNIEKAIRSWNGGMNFSTKRTQRYYERVMSFLK